ncbi:MAG: MBOAT family protein [Syntrophaceae bacterium]|nr:MBOAT family protein [Syntrophaceae bacterium]
MAGWLWLVFASLFFYGWGGLTSIPILLASVVFNYVIGTLLQKQRNSGRQRSVNAKLFLILGLVFNIIFLGYFKYADFFIVNINWIFDRHLPALNILLPLAISFFTFHQISYLVDSYRGQIKGSDLLEYTTYITFFPKLISGPIVRYSEFAPQLKNLKASIDYRQTSIGLFLFFIGLLKVTTAARVFGVWADKGFADAASLSLVDGWTTCLSYTFQIYFDFSGYIDMALGSARFFNIQLPINFDSPYRAVNIQDFWRRWHITLSRFLRDYIYIPLGGSRKGELTTYANIILAFLICGIWHGAGWLFILWGALHGFGMVLHRLWQKTGIKMPKILAIFVTFIFVNIAWIFFRAADFSQALYVIKSMTGLSTTSGFSILHGIPASEIIIAVVSIIVVFFAPNSNRILERFRPSVSSAVCLTTVILIGLLFLNSSVPREFIYFDF